MRRSLKLIAILLAAVWLLATHHAVLEITGVMFDQASASVEGVPVAADPAHERWHQAEKSAAKQRLLFAEVWVVGLVLVCLFRVALPAFACLRAPVRWTSFARDSLGWIPDWTFARRATPAIRAP